MLMEEDMASRSSDSAADRPPILSSAEIDELLSMTLIANLATLDHDDDIHLLPMWFLRIGNDICIPTSSHTHKYRNLRARPNASVMIDLSRAGLDLKGVLIRGRVELVYGEKARQINRLIHLKYVTPEGERRQRRCLPLQRRRCNRKDSHGSLDQLEPGQLKGR